MVIVTGYHRSGTSMLARLVHENGVCMGTPESLKTKPTKHNRAGHYEDTDFRNLNDLLLKERGYKVTSWKVPTEKNVPVEPGREVAQRMAALIVGREERGIPWGFKDPRTMLTVGAWAHVMRSLFIPFRIILIRRNSREVGISQQVRGDCCPQQSAKLQQAYYMRFLASLAITCPNKLFLQLDYGRCLEYREETAKAIGEFVGIGIKNLSAIRPHLRRSAAND